MTNPGESGKPGEITKAQVTKFMKATFNKDAWPEVEDEDVLGIMVSGYVEWDGFAIIRAFSSALEDANFHTENAKVREMFPEAFEDDVEDND